MHTRHLKILGLSLLALVGVMAVSASGAQANWLLLNPANTSVDELNVSGPILLSELLVPGLELAIHCKGGKASALLKKLNGGATLSGSGSALFTEMRGIRGGRNMLKSTARVTKAVKSKPKAKAKAQWKAQQPTRY